MNSNMKIIKRNENITSAEDYVKKSIGNISDDVEESSHVSYKYTNLKEAVDLFIQHIRVRAKIVIYGDYDADGVTSLTIFKLLGRVLNTELKVIAPDRFSDGYGLNTERAKQFIADKVDLVITVDNGISAGEAIKMLRDAGIDVIVLDHHELNGEVPNANVVVDPHVTGGDFDDLCGAGLSLRFACDCLTRIGSLKKERTQMIIDQMYAVAAIGTIADVVTLRQDNRYIVKRGLSNLNDGKAPVGIKALCEKTLGSEIAASDVAFTLAPCINAAGRLCENGASKVVDVFTAPNVFLGGIANKIDEMIALNSERKELVNAEIERALGILNVRKDDRVVIYINKLGKPGIMGLVASKLAEEYKRPAIALCGDAVLKGSGRTYGDIDLFAGLSKASDLLNSFGGHKEACGLSFDRDKLEEVRGVLNTNLPKAEIKDVVYYDIELTNEDPETVLDVLKVCEPFGCGNPAPKFLLTGEVTSAFRFGKEREHVKITCDDIDVMAFNYSARVPKKGSTISVVGDLSINTYNGKTAYQLIADYME